MLDNIKQVFGEDNFPIVQSKLTPTQLIELDSSLTELDNYEGPADDIVMKWMDEQGMQDTIRQVYEAFRMLLKNLFDSAVDADLAMLVAKIARYIQIVLGM